MCLSTEVGDTIDYASGILKAKDHNARTVTCRLPPEILAHIFFINTMVDPDDDHDPKCQFTLFACTQVCSYWRGVAFEYANLWTHIVTLECARKPEWTRFLLSRSRSAPLHLHVNLEDAPESNLSIVFEQLSRVQSLLIYASSASLESIFPFLTVSSAWMLESLSVNILEYDDEIDLPDRLFNNIAPRLHSLKLYRCGINWNSFILSSGLLTHLRIADIPSSSMPSYSQLLRLFKNSQNLEKVSFASEFFPSLPEELPFQNIPLPNLSFIRIYGDLWDCARLLSHLDYPSDTAVGVFGIAAWSKVDISPIMASLRTRGLEGSGKERRARLDVTEDVVQWTVMPSGVASAIRSSTIVISHNHPPYEKDISRLVLATWQVLRYAPIVELELHVATSNVISEEVAREILEGLSVVEGIILKDLSRPFFATLFGAGATSSSSSCLPLLRKVTFAFDIMGVFEFDPFRTVLDRIYEFVSQRSNSGCPVESIVSRYPIEDQELNSLRAQVARVEFGWDAILSISSVQNTLWTWTPGLQG